MALGEPVTLHFYAPKGKPVILSQDQVLPQGGGPLHMPRLEYFVACQPHVRYFRKELRFSGDPRVVNCEKCKKTKAYQESLAFWGSEIKLGDVPQAVVEKLGV